MKREHIVRAIALAIEGKESYVSTLPVVDEIMNGLDPTFALRRAMPDAEWREAAKNISELDLGRSVIFHACEAEKLCGYTISETVVRPDFEEWGLLLTHPEKENVVAWVRQDPEGNGPGHLDVLPEIE